MLSRFQLKSTYKRDADGQFVNPKNVIDVKQFGGAGTFIVQANILNLQYKLYEACPTAAQNGHLCNRKLSDQRLCSSCGLVAKNPTDAILLRLELQDLMDKECRQNTTMFTSSAQKYLGRKASEMRMMEQEGDGEGDMASERKKAKITENICGQSQPHPKQPKWDFRSMAYFEQHPTESQMDESVPTQNSGADIRQTGMGQHSISTNADGGQEQKPLYEEITNHIHKMERFSVQRHVTEFVLNAQHEQPDEALRQALHQLVNRAVQNVEKQSGRSVSKLGIMVAGKGLTDPVVLPLRPPAQNNIDVVMAEMDKLGQSEGDEGGVNKKTLLLSEPVEIIVTCLTIPAGSAPRFFPHQNWGYNQTQIIHISNRDNYCLFHALAAGRAYHDYEIFRSIRSPPDNQAPLFAVIMNRTDFCKDYEAYNRLLSNTGRMESVAEDLMKNSGIIIGQDSYGIDHLLPVQQYWTGQKSYPGQYGKAQEDIVLTVYRSDNGQRHKCDTSYCKRCKVYHDKKASCFIKKIKMPEEEASYRIVVWDTETRLEKLEDEGQRIHVVNFLSARITCTDCCDASVLEADCEICCQSDGTLERTKQWSEADGDDQPVAAFVEWILRAWNKQYKTYIWAHNASRFDGHFALNYLCKTVRRPDVVMNGLRIYEFRVRHSPKHSMLIWRDSCLIMPIALADLKKTFSLDCEDKPFFPYAFNRRENYGIRLEKLPDAQMYEPGSMKADKYEKFKKCACMNIFKAQFMQEDQLAMVPELGYERNDRASVIAIKYLDWRAKNEGIDIQHAGNGREKQWKKFKLDGWIESQQRCIEVLGCYWHGCDKCFKPDEQLVDGKSCQELNEMTQDRLRQLREPDADGRSLQVEEIWECEINDQLKKNDEMKVFFDDLANERGPLDPRLAYCGGRTGPLRLFAEASADEKISVFDIVSLYPWVNYDTAYPIGVPTIIRPSAEEMIVNWTKPEHLSYQGLYRVRVIPPRGLRIPVLPMKIDERLLFSCCHRCAALFRKSVTRCAHKCEHSEQQRAFTGNFTHIELEKALEMGYVMIDFGEHGIMMNGVIRAIRVLYKPKKNFIVEHTSSNIVLSLWTTSRARLKLLDYMLQCYNTPGTELLYTDTDSVIVRHKRDLVPVHTGEYLGQMSEEYTDYEILTFACGGAKQYAMKMVHKQTKAVKFVQKIRGITFDVNNSQELQFEHFVRKVINYGKEDEQENAAIFNYNKIQPTKDNRIITRKQNKKYLPVCQKGIINQTLEVLPFGYE
ncbi:hypothetical protein niasHT_039070 [Heterodera trifolii]|uniref:DNA-directed DNA polymerase n=1 Tax=Heterodera trifolii TaxID=157864 RepID=A0ABD2HR03_9BILA